MGLILGHKRSQEHCSRLSGSVIETVPAKAMNSKRIEKIAFGVIRCHRNQYVCMGMNVAMDIGGTIQSGDGLQCSVHLPNI